MPLNWNATDCNPDALAEDVYNRTAHFCYVLMAVGAPSITEENYRELYERASLYETLFGEIFYGKPLSIEDFELRIGYRTNNSKLTRKQFLSRIEERWFDPES